MSHVKTIILYVVCLASIVIATASQPTHGGTGGTANEPRSSLIAEVVAEPFGGDDFPGILTTFFSASYASFQFCVHRFQFTFAL